MPNSQTGDGMTGARSERKKERKKEEVERTEEYRRSALSERPYKAGQTIPLCSDEQAPAGKVEGGLSEQTLAWLPVPYLALRAQCRSRQGSGDWRLEKKVWRTVVL